MKSAILKDSRLDLRLDKRQKSLLERAAASQGVKLSEFVISKATEAAEIALAEETQILFSEEAMERFTLKLDEPGVAIPQLRELFLRDAKS